MWKWSNPYLIRVVVPAFSGVPLPGGLHHEGTEGEEGKSHGLEWKLLGFSERDETSGRRSQMQLCVKETVQCLKVEEIFPHVEAPNGGLTQMLVCKPFTAKPPEGGKLQVMM